MSADLTVDDVNAYLAETMPRDPAVVEEFRPDHVRLRRTYNAATTRRTRVSAASSR